MEYHLTFKSFYLILGLWFCAGSFSAQTIYQITDPEELEDHTYVPGDEIVLANGIYATDTRLSFVGNGTVDNPITFRSETPGGVKFTGGLRMDIGGDYVVVDGFHWQGGYGASNFIQFRDGYDYANYSTIQNCAIDGLAIEPDDIIEGMEEGSITKHRWVVLYGTYNTIINCSFMNKSSAGALVLAEYEYNAEADRCASVGHTISNNYFYNYDKIDPNLSNAGDSETIRIGTSEYQNINSDVLVSNNYFVKSDGENEIITNKSKGNIYANNTFRRCRGSLVLRHGSKATVEGNYFLGENVEGTGGIRITDSDHTITNNYIQDCITVNSQAKWNNGITFLGGGDSNDIICTSTSVSNGYQKSFDINVSNNTIVNTNAPLFYNTDKGSTDPTGVVANNLIYFSVGNSNLSDLITGDTPYSYNNLGTALNYTGNVYANTSNNALNAGFTEESGLVASLEGEILTFSGAEGKGADLGSSTPITDEMVGNSIGACFLDHTGGRILDGECTIIEGEVLTVSGLETLGSSASTSSVIVNANVSWSAISNDDWITVSPSMGTGSATVMITVADNLDPLDRVGTVTFVQDEGEDDIVQTLTVNQVGLTIEDLYQLINVGTGMSTDLVRIHDFSKEEVDGVSKFNYASNSLDKDHSTNWSADDGGIVDGDYKGDGEYIIYTLGVPHVLDLIQFSTTNKDDAFGFQVWVSTTGTEDADFHKILPESEDLLLTSTNSTEFNHYLVSGTEALYVKLIGFGRFNADQNTRLSVWSSIGEIEFYGDTLLSLDGEDVDHTSIYPIPADDILYIKDMVGIELISIHDLNGRMLLKQSVSNTEALIKTSRIKNGSYILILQGDQVYYTKRLVITH